MRVWLCMALLTLMSVEVQAKSFRFSVDLINVSEMDEVAFGVRYGAVWVSLEERGCKVDISYNVRYETEFVDNRGRSEVVGKNNGEYPGVPVVYYDSKAGDYVPAFNPYRLTLRFDGRAVSSYQQAGRNFELDLFDRANLKFMGGFKVDEFEDLHEQHRHMADYWDSIYDRCLASLNRKQREREAQKQAAFEREQKERELQIANQWKVAAKRLESVLQELKLPVTGWQNIAENVFLNPTNHVPLGAVLSENGRQIILMEQILLRDPDQPDQFTPLQKLNAAQRTDWLTEIQGKQFKLPLIDSYRLSPYMPDGHIPAREAMLLGRMKKMFSMDFEMYQGRDFSFWISDGYAMVSPMFVIYDMDKKLRIESNWLYQMHGSDVILNTQLMNEVLPRYYSEFFPEHYEKLRNGTIDERAVHAPFFETGLFYQAKDVPLNSSNSVLIVLPLNQPEGDQVLKDIETFNKSGKHVSLLLSDLQSEVMSNKKRMQLFQRLQNKEISEQRYGELQAKLYDEASRDYMNVRCSKNHRKALKEHFNSAQKVPAAECISGGEYRRAEHGILKRYGLGNELVYVTGPGRAYKGYHSPAQVK